MKKKKKLKCAVFQLTDRVADKGIALITVKAILLELKAGEVDSCRVNKINQAIQTINAGLDK